MSHTNTTTNYNLPQFLSSDKPAWMADMNVAFNDIDGQMKLNADAAANAQSDVNDHALNFAAGYSNASTYDVGDVVVYNNRMYICDIAVTVPEAFDIAKWTYYRVSDTADAVANVTSAENALETLVGSTDISAIGDGTCTGAIDTINTNLSEKSYYDFGGGVSLNNDIPWVATSDGYVTYHCGVTSGDYCNLYLNTILVGGFGTTTSLSANPYQVVYVRKGMTIKFVGSTTASATFYPLA